MRTSNYNENAFGVNNAAYDSAIPNSDDNYYGNQNSNQASYTSQRPPRLGQSERGHFAARFRRDSSRWQQNVANCTTEHDEAKAHHAKISADLDSKNDSLKSEQDNSKKAALQIEIASLEKDKENSAKDLVRKELKLEHAKGELLRAEAALKNFGSSNASIAIDSAYKRPVAATVANDLNSLADEYDKFASHPLMSAQQKEGLKQDAANMREIAKDLKANKYDEHEIELLSSQTTQAKDNFTRLDLTLKQNKVFALNNLLEHLNVIFNQIQKVQAAQMARADNILDRLTMIR